LVEGKDRAKPKSQSLRN